MEQKLFTWNSEDYAKQSGAQFKWAQELISKLNLTGNESVLDIGCGDGKVTALLSGQLPGGSVTGIDSSEEMIALAKKNHPPAYFSNLSFAQMDAVKLEFENIFDAAFSNAALHWVKDQIPLLNGVHKNLKNAGRILFQLGGKGNALDFFNVVNEIITDKRWDMYFKKFSFPWNFASPDEYRRWLDQTGFSVTRAELIEKDMSQQGKEGLAGWVRTTWMPYTNRVPANNQDQFIDEIVSTYIDRFPMDPDGFVHVKMVRLEIEAVKA